MDGALQTDPVTDRNIDWIDPAPGAQHRADNFLFVHQWNPGTFDLREIPMGADKPALGHANRGCIRQQTQMTGQTKAARMRQSLPVTQEHVGWLP